MTFLVVTPARNESKNLPQLFETILSQTSLPSDFVWIIVPNNCTDNTAEVSKSFNARFPIEVTPFHGIGGMGDVLEYQAFFFAVNDFIKRMVPEYVMKLDADVLLDSNYFQELEKFISQREGVFGGVNRTRKEREQHDDQLVRGATSCYSFEAYKLLTQLPCALGIDVLDKIFIRKNGMLSQVTKAATYTVQRQTSSSEGMRRGRLRNGRVCRWTGYNRFYFVLHLLRYLSRRPYLISVLYIVFGYLQAGPGPYSADLKKEHSNYQYTKMINLFKSPFSTLNKYYLD